MAKSASSDRALRRARIRHVEGMVKKNVRALKTDEAQKRARVNRLRESLKGVVDAPPVPEPPR